MSPPGARWMQDNREAFGEQHLSTLCLPASHDAGTYRRSFGTTFGTESNVLTQTRSIFDQLEFGVRRLDIRPHLASPGGEGTVTWGCGHYTGEAESKIGWQGASCVPISEVVDDLNRFTKDNAELIIVDISHVYKIFIKNPIASTRGFPSSDEWKGLLKLLSGINNLADVGRFPGLKDIPLRELRLNYYIGSGKAAVIVLVDEYNDHNEIFRHGCWPAYMTNGQAYGDMKSASVTRMQGTGDAIYSTINPWQLLGAEWNSESVLSLAKKAQDEQFPWLLQQVASDGLPSAIWMDRIQNADLLTFCLAISHQHLIQNGAMKPQTIVVYGGVITFAQGLNEVNKAIYEGKGLNATNGSMHMDPWGGLTKSAAVFWSDDGVLKGRWAQENWTLHFEQDALSIEYGRQKIRNQAVYLKLLKAIATRQLFVVNNDNLGGNDPQPGVKKTCVVRYRDLNSSKVEEVKEEEYRAMDFESFWEKIGKATAGSHFH